jgi:hypothetical protein
MGLLSQQFYHTIGRYYKTPSISHKILSLTVDYLSTEGMPYSSSFQGLFGSFKTISSSNGGVKQKGREPKTHLLLISKVYFKLSIFQGRWF